MVGSSPGNHCPLEQIKYGAFGELTMVLGISIFYLLKGDYLYLGQEHHSRSDKAFTE